MNCLLDPRRGEMCKITEAQTSGWIFVRFFFSSNIGSSLCATLSCQFCSYCNWDLATTLDIKKIKGKINRELMNSTKYICIQHYYGVFSVWFYCAFAQYIHIPSITKRNLLLYPCSGNMNSELAECVCVCVGVYCCCDAKPKYGKREGIIGQYCKWKWDKYYF